MSGTATTEIEAYYGPIIIGGMFAFALSGCVNAQFLVYLQTYSGPGERLATQSLVSVAWFLDLCHSAFVAVAVWDSIIPIYGDLKGVDIIPWSVGLTVELTAMLTFLVQGFFAYRIYRLQRRKLLVAGPVFTLSFLRLVAASVSMTEVIRLRSYFKFAHTFANWFLTVGLSLSAIVDIMITAFLCYFLRSNRSQVLMSSTNRMIDTLTLWSLETGSVTCLGTITALICWITMPQTRVFLGVHFAVAKLYANSLLATLNARSRILQPRSDNLAGQMVPIPVLSNGVFKDPDEDSGPETPKIPRLHLVGVDAQRPRHMSSGHATPRIEVNMEQIVESIHDNASEVNDSKLRM